jgi:hypothetical protein
MNLGSHLLDSGFFKSKLVVKILEVLSQNKINLRRFVLDGSLALRTNEIGAPRPRFEPSDLLRRLVATIRADRFDELEIIIHDAPSGDLSASQ